MLSSSVAFTVAAVTELVTSNAFAFSSTVISAFFAVISESTTKDPPVMLTVGALHVIPPFAARNVSAPFVVPSEYMSNFDAFCPVWHIVKS